VRPGCGSGSSTALALSAVLALAAAAGAQQGQGPQPQPQQPQPQQPASTQAPITGNEVQFAEAVLQLQGKNVRSIQVVKSSDRGQRTTSLDAGSTDSIVRSLLTRVGQPFEARRVSTDCASLWSERRLVVRALAEEVEGEVAVTFIVDLEVEVYEGVEFVGLRHLDLATVNSLLGLYVDRQTTRTEAEAMRKVLLARYRRDGLAFCDIRLEERQSDSVAPDAPGPRQRLRFVVEEGPRVRVRNLTFTGNKSFAADSVLGLFGTDTYLVRDARIDSDPARGILPGGSYSREVLDEDLDRLRLFYRSRGFLEATVDLADVTFTESRDRVDISFVIVEGPRYRIRSVRVQHVDADRREFTATPLYAAAELEAVLKVRAGDFYDNDRLQRDALAIEDFYGERGHPPFNYPGMLAAAREGCRVFPALEIYGEGPEVDIVFQVSEGSPKRLRDVVIRGNRFTRDHVIRRRFRVLPGERIDMVEVQRALRRIEQTRFFQDPVSLRGPRLQIEPVPGDPELVDLGLDLEDGPTGELRWGVGISTGIGAQAQITFNKRNFDLWNPPSSANPITAIGEILDAKAFHGGGQNLAMLLAPGTRQSQFSLTFVEPDVFRQHFETYELRVTGQRRLRRLPDGYTSDVLGAEVGLSRNLTENLNIGIAARHETVQIESLAQDATVLAFDAEGQTELRGTRLSVRYRDVDDFLRPSSGFDLGAAAEVIGGPFGGEESLTKWTHTANAWVTLAENEMGHRTVFHFEQFFGVANEFGGSDDVFLTERFYMGGANLRGFDFRRAGPTQFGRPIGGEAVYTATAEIFFPLVATRLEGEVRDRELLRWVVFTDIGFLGLGLDEPTFREMRASSGIGIRIEIPYLELPIALDLGWPWLYEETDTRRQLFFSISR
jgi:outer membrane protein insertion porin family